MNASLLENAQRGVRWYCFVQGVDQKLDFYFFYPGHSMLSIFTRTAFVFCAALLCKMQAEESQDREEEISFLCHHSNQINFKTCICRSFIVMERKIKNTIFTIVMSVFLPALLSVSNLVSKASVLLILWKLKIYFSV